MNRRTFLKRAAAAWVVTKMASSAAVLGVEGGTPEFKTGNARWQAAYDQALVVLAGNVRVMPRYDKPVLIEGSVYQWHLDGMRSAGGVGLQEVSSGCGAQQPSDFF